MRNKARVKGWLLLLLSGLLHLLGAATLVGMVAALLIPDTITAVESAFGAFVLGILLLVFARHCWDRGKRLLESGAGPVAEPPGEEAKKI